MRKIYVACSLTQAPESFKQAVAGFKEEIKRTVPDIEVLDFIGLVNGTPAEVYHWDIHHCVSTCDLLVAICDYPAIGLGYELGVAVEQLHKHVLAAAHKDCKVTRLLLGIDVPGFRLVRYSELTELVPMVVNELDQLVA